MPHSVQSFAFLLLDGFSNMVLASAVEPLRAANYCAGKTIFDWSLISAGSQTVRSSSGIQFVVDGVLGQLAEADWLVVVCGYRARELSTPSLCADLRRASKKCAVLSGVDAGPWVLAEAGLLNGRKATMHWLDLSAFQTEFPDIVVLPDRFVLDGNRVTAGGATTVLELMLRVIRDSCGEAVAFDVSNTFVYNSDRVGMDNRGARSLSVMTRHPQLMLAINEMRRTVAEPVPLQRLADVAGCSTRTLHRLFLKELQIPPGRYFELVRLSHARSLIEETTLSSYQIAAETGYESVPSLSKAFRKRFGVSLMAARKVAVS